MAWLVGTVHATRAATTDRPMTKKPNRVQRPRKSVSSPPAAVESVYAEIGQRIVHARLSRKMTQATLGLALGLSRPAIANIEAGKQRLYAHHVVALVKALDVSVFYLIQTDQPSRCEPSMKDLAILRGGLRDISKRLDNLLKI